MNLNPQITQGPGEELALTRSWDEEVRVISDQIRSLARNGSVLQILEAGCGRRWDIDLAGVDFVLTGVDLDKAALEARKNIVKDLDEPVEGDLRTVVLREHHYDVIFSSYVLEHVSGAETVLKNFVRWVKPGGLIIIRIPDPRSVQGFITRVTPHWFHVLYYRLMGSKNAGKPGYAPYPVYYDRVVSRAGIRSFCRANDLMVVAEYGDAYFKPGRGAARIMLQVAKRVINMMSLGSLSARHTNLLLILGNRD